ncbi:MAG TPA: MFS transporter [Armatimonadota bacterium]|nr:MFS transporter [Armatimonadota bacterium]
MMPHYRRNTYVLSIAIFLAALSWNQIVPFLSLFLKEMHISEGQLLYWTGLVFAVQSVASILAMPYWGKLGDKYGRKPMIIRAGICLAGIYFGMSLCQTPLQLAVLRFLNGALTGFIPGSFALIATNTPEKAAPRAMATAQTASASGVIIGPAVGMWLASLLGYRCSMQVSGAAVIISTILVWRLVQEPNKVKPIEKTSLIQDFIISIRSPVQLSIMFAVFLSWCFASAINPYLVLHLKEFGGSVPDWLLGWIFPLPALAFVLTAHSWTRFGERTSFDRAIFIGLIGAALGAVTLFFPHNIWVFAVLYFITGIWIAALSPSIGALTCTKVEESFRGRAYGIQQSAGTLGALLAPLAAAQVGALFGIRAIFIFVGVLFFVGAFVFVRLCKRWKLAGKKY